MQFLSCTSKLTSHYQKFYVNWQQDALIASVNVLLTVLTMRVKCLIDLGSRAQNLLFYKSCHTKWLLTNGICMPKNLSWLISFNYDTLERVYLTHIVHFILYINLDKTKISLCNKIDSNKCQKEWPDLCSIVPPYRTPVHTQ